MGSAWRVPFGVLRQGHRERCVRGENSGTTGFRPLEKPWPRFDAVTEAVIGVRVRREVLRM
jgi:hypothetical protein